METLYGPGNSERLRRILAGLFIFAMVFSAILLAIILGLADNNDTTDAPDPLAMSNSPDQPRLFYQTIGDSPLVPETPTEKIDTRFTIELAVARSKSEAERFVETYQKQGITAYYTPFSNGGKILYRVRLGLYQSPAKAESDLATLSSQQNLRGKVVRLQ